MRKVVAALVILLGLALPTFGQQNSGMAGTVTDASGAAFPGVQVKVTSRETGLSRIVTTGDAGNYSIPDLPIGVYKVEAAKKGFKTAVLDNLKLDIQRTARVDFSMQVGAVAQQVVVTSATPLLQTTESSVGTLIENQQIVDLPIDGRNYLQLNFLVPGTTPGSSNADYIFSTHGDSAQSFSVNGIRSIYNGYLVDGVPTQEVADGAPSFEPSIDSIQEFRSETSNYSAQFGSMAGGQNDVVTKSGTNSFHGSAFEFVRNDVFDALPYNFSTVAENKASLNRNDFGGTLGGPIFKKRTFFFASYEGARLTGGGTSLGLVPTKAERQGDLSLLPDGTPNPFQLYDPISGQPYVNNQVPVNPVIGKFLQEYVPLPNSPYDPQIITNYSINSSSTLTHANYSGRIDHSITPNDLIFGRWIYGHVDNPSPKFFPTDSFAIRSTGQNWALGYTRLVGTNKVNDLRVGYNRFWQNEGNGRTGKVNVLADLGMTGLCDLPQCWGEPDFNVFGFAGFGEHGNGQTYSSPRYWSDEIFEISDTFTYTGDRHTLRAGIALDDYHDSFAEAIVPRGIYSFDGHFTAPDQQAHPETSLADFLVGDPQNIVASITPFTPYWSYHGITPWIQDDWRVTHALTLNLGLRYEYLGRPTSRYDDWTNIDFSTNPPQLVTPATAAEHHFPHALVDTHYKDFGPRIGFAWAPTQWNRLVLRGAYGVYYGRDLIGTWTDASINPPFVSQYSYTPAPSDLPAFSIADPLVNAPASAVLYDSIARNMREALIQEWNLSTQFEISKSTQVTASYVANRGSHLTRQYDINQAFPGSTTPNVVGPTPYPTFGPIMYTDSEAFSNYNSLQVQGEHRYSHGLSLLSAYTFAKCIDDSPGSDYGEGGVHYINIRNWNQMKGLCNQNLKQRFSLSYLYDLPFGRNRLFAVSNSAIEALIGGWQVSGIIAATTGNPYTVIIDQDRANSGDTGAAASTPNAEPPNVIANPNLSASKRNRLEYFNTSAFAYPDWGQYGNGRRNNMIGPGMVGFDVGLFRNFSAWREMKIQLRAEAFNVLNHVNYGLPDPTFGSPTFGQILSAGSMRQMQIAIKATF